MGTISVVKIKRKTKAVKKPITKYLVEVVEHDSWSGPSKIETLEFTSKTKADKYVNGINGQNTDRVVPDYYVTASIVKTYTIMK